MVWVNIYKPTKKYTVHSNNNCTYSRRVTETPHKGVNELKRDGGWIEFDSLANARARQQLQYTDYTVVEHC